MTAEEFNIKYEPYLEKGHYGLAIDDTEVIAYLDKEFEKEIAEHSDFNYAQIKLKFNMPRAYTSSNNNQIWETTINKILRNKRKIKGKANG